MPFQWMDMPEENNVSIEKVHEAIKGLGNAEELKGIIDTVMSAKNTAEQDLRTLKATQEEIKDLNIAELKASAKFIQDQGGMDSVIASISKGNGAEDAQAENTRLKAEHQKQVETLTNEGKGYQDDAKKANLIATVQGEFNKTFRNTRGLLLNDAICSEFLSVNDNGTPVITVNGVTKPYNDGGIALLAEHPDYKPDKISPDGSNDPLKTPNKEQNGGGSETWWNPNNN